MRANYKMKRLFLDADLEADGLIKLDKAQANYVGNVLRMKTGDALLLFNGRDGEWEAQLVVEDKRNIGLEIKIRIRPQPASSDFLFCFAPLKVGRLDYMVQKAVEMGAGVLQPVMTEHTQNHHIKIEKLKANAIEAAEQCGVLHLPTVETPVSLDAMLKDWDRERTLIFCDEDASTNNPVHKLTGLDSNPLAVLIGPEGGFSDAERAQLRALDFVVSMPLGPRILRADTAAVAAMAVIQAVAGDW